jgi:hypothetical protein
MTDQAHPLGPGGVGKRARRLPQLMERTLSNRKANEDTIRIVRSGILQLKVWS